MQFLEHITQALCDHLPALWKLGHVFLPVVLEDESGRLTSRLFENFSLEEHVGDGTVTREKEIEVRTRINCRPCPSARQCVAWRKQRGNHYRHRLLHVLYLFRLPRAVL